ncbi:MAG: MltA domain-containing protein, partial [Coleofasciculus sp. S288]|nr:MltA domain-containing protein [Coleofasciculus sp. S288]
MRRLAAVIALSLSGVLWILLHGLTQPLRNGDNTKTQRLVAQENLREIPALSCRVLSSSAHPFQKPAPIGPVLSRGRGKLFKANAGTSFKGCGLQNLGVDDQIWDRFDQPGDKAALLKSIDNSLRYLQSSAAVAAYRRYPVVGVTRDRVLRSLLRFRQLVLSSRSAAELETAVKREFTFYQSVGKDGLGNVLFTAYYEPVYAASRVPTSEYRYPLYRRPPNLSSWRKPHPTREQLEGKDGLQGSKGKLRGLELFWLRDRVEAYMIHIQGSARLILPDGTQTTVGYAGN